MKLKRTKLVAGFMCLVVALGAFAGCGKTDPPTGQQPADPSNPNEPVQPGPEETSPWTAEPVVKSTFYSDFGS
ncbi:MAG: hypothetical protein K2H43_03320, partial [Clostridia bacterium]|nr:hypothetical protein [Clostridia bacterium]